MINLRHQGVSLPALPHRLLIISAVLSFARFPVIAEENTTMHRYAIAGPWSFRDTSGSSWLPATVPGCIHTDLLRNGDIPDPFFGTNEQQLQWIGEKDWVYQTMFDLPAGMLMREQVELVFKGLDTYATVTLNDAPVLKANNMFREWRVECKSLLKEQGNRLTITFRNVFDENLPRYWSAPFELQAFPNNDQADVRISMYSRKAQFHYGWDWGPRLITCGVWRPVYLEAWDGARIKGVRVQQDNVTGFAADITSFLEIVSTGQHSVRVAATMDSQSIGTAEIQLHEGVNTITLNGRILQPRLWWTNGLGEQHLYRFRAAITFEDGSVEEHVESVGVRSLEIVREKDSLGTSFYVLLNGVPIFMKGANYIPQDNFQNRVSAERYENTVGSAARANMNMLRVWGGGIYEEDLFYELCDRYGILVWHDMMFACAMYPADEEFLKNVRQEVVENISRIRNHASIALYCGNNENEIGWHTWGWKQLYSPATQAAYESSMHTLFHEVIPAAVREADPMRYYHYSSPTGGLNNVSPNEGDTHYWGVWHGKEPFEAFEENVSRFVSEYGFQSYPQLSSVEKFTQQNDRDLHSPVMLAHQRCMADGRRDKEYGNTLIQTYLERYFRTPKDFSSYLYASQVLQAEGVRKAIEAHRKSMPLCMGSLFWQIDDCWPVASWSSIDYYGEWKALQYVARKAYAPIIVVPAFRGDSIEFHIISDQLDSLAAVLAITVQDFAGMELFRRSMPIIVKPNASGKQVTFSRKELMGGGDKNRLVMISRLMLGGSVETENLSHFVYPKDLDLQHPVITATANQIPGGYEVHLTTNTFAKSVHLSCERSEGMFCDNYFELLPREARVVQFQTRQEVSDFEKRLKIVSLVDTY